MSSFPTTQSYRTERICRIGRGCRQLLLAGPEIVATSKLPWIADILKHPRTDEEERLAAEYIRVECERIQAGWSAHERARRQIVKNDTVLVREVATSELVARKRRA